MRFIGISIFILLSNISIGQTSWFKHLPGWQARTTLAKGDTLVTCGQSVSKMPTYSKYEVFLFWSKLNIDSLNFFKISLDSLESDSAQSTTISYNYNSSVDLGGRWGHFIGLNYGKKKERAFVLLFKNFYSKEFKLEEYTKDTFSTYVNNIVCLPKVDIIFSPYAPIEEPLHFELNTIIYKQTNINRIKIKEIKNTSSEKYETTCHIKDNTSSKSFFFIMRKMWDYAGAPRQWENYIIKMDTLGNELWRCQPNNRDSINTEGMQMVQKSNGNILVSWCDYDYRPYKNMIGSNEPQLNRRCTVWFAEIDEYGKVLWRKNMRKYLSLKVSDTTQDLRHNKAILVKDGILWSGNYSYYYRHNYLLKTDFNGNPIWYREYELYKTNTAEQEFIPYDVTATSDGGYVLTGEFISQPGNIFKNGCQLATIIKVDSFGCLEPGCQKADSATTAIKDIKKIGCKVYPNPANETVNIELPKGKNGDYVLEVFDIQGKLIEKISIHTSIELNTSKYANGFYLFKLYNEKRNEIETHKITVYH